MFTYSDKDFIYETSSENVTVIAESRFDKNLQEKWNAAVEKGYFRYRLKITDWKTLPGNYKFLAQLNSDRATNRRAPQDITSLNQPFDANRFNFTQVAEHEILFKLKRENCKSLVANTSEHSDANVTRESCNVGAEIIVGNDESATERSDSCEGEKREEGRDTSCVASNVDDSSNREDSRQSIAKTSIPCDDVLQSPRGDDGDYLAINVSPLEYCNALLLPAPHARQPQVATADSLALCVHLVLLSNTPSLRIAFNSLCGYASVNHLHYHIYYLQHNMLLETIKVRHLSGPCYEMTDFPARGFVFQLPRDRDAAQLARSVHRLTSYLQDHDVAHNIYLTRGTALDEPCATGDATSVTYSTVRVYVWARTPKSGAKDSGGFYPAVCELFGHLSMKQAELYEAITEELVGDVLDDVCRPVFDAVRPNVIELFK